MAKINTGRVLIGGLLAGLVINIGEIILNVFILAADWADVNEKLQAPGMESTGLTIWYIIAGFILGIAGVWIYAGYRPRCGAGPKTALAAGSTVWLLTYFVGYSWAFFGGLFPMALFWWTMIWGFVELNLALVVGARFYAEED